MFLNPRPFVLVASLIALPVVGAVAQQNNQQADSASNRPSSAAQNPNTPGATGRTIVPGDRSTIAADRPATAETKTGVVSTGSAGGGAGQ
jgi:hypothetical protein